MWCRIHTGGDMDAKPDTQHYCNAVVYVSLDGSRIADYHCATYRTCHSDAAAERHFHRQRHPHRSPDLHPDKTA
jgi:hypothetical protein